MATLELVGSGILYRNPLPGHQVTHASTPFTVELSPTELLCVYRRGTAFYSPDGVIAKARSTDGGATWQDDGVAWDPAQDDAAYSYAAPNLTLLRDGSLVLVQIRRDHSGQGRLAVNQQTGAFLPVDTMLSRSTDGGHTWSRPEVIGLPAGSVMDVSGPIIELEPGRWFLPFDQGKAWDDPRPLRVTMHGFFSTDEGRTWGDRVTIADGAATSTGFFHGRVMRLCDGRLFTLMWSRDEASGAFLSLHRVTSDLRAETWSDPAPTGIPGQTSWAVDLGDGRMVAAFTHREGGTPGIHAALSLDGGVTWDLDRTVLVWDATGRETVGVVSIDQYPQSHDVIAFGKPMAIGTSDGDVLVSYWCTEHCVTQARWARLRVV